MKYVCMKRCYYRAPGTKKPVLFAPGQVVRFQEEPNMNLFAEAERARIDFDKSSEAHLAASEVWTIEEAAKWLEGYEIDMDTEDPPTRKAIARLIVDTRYRHADIPDED